MDKKIIIFYNNNLRSKIIYGKFIKLFPSKIECLVQVPHGESFFLRKFLLSFYKLPLHIKIYYILNNLFILIPSFLRNDLNRICKKISIKHFVLDHAMLPSRFCEINKLNRKNFFFFYSTPNILKLGSEESKINLLNIHDADTLLYRGLLCLDKMKLSSDNLLRSTLHKINNIIDKGEIIKYSRKINIKKRDILYSTLISWLLGSEIMLSRNYNSSKLLKNLNNHYTEILNVDLIKKIEKSNYEKFSLKAIKIFITLVFTLNIERFYLDNNGKIRFNYIITPLIFDFNFFYKIIFTYLYKKILNIVKIKKFTKIFDYGSGNQNLNLINKKFYNFDYRDYEIIRGDKNVKKLILSIENKKEVFVAIHVFMYMTSKDLISLMRILKKKQITIIFCASSMNIIKKILFIISRKYRYAFKSTKLLEEQLRIILKYYKIENEWSYFGLSKIYFLKPI